MVTKDYLSYFSSKIQVILTGGSLPEDADFVSYLSLKGEIEEDEVDCQEEIKTCLSEIKNLEIKEKMSEICGQIKKAEEEKNQKRINNLTKEFNNLSSQLMDNRQK